MIEVVRTLKVDDDGVLRVSLPEFQAGTEVTVTVRAVVSPSETADSNPDVEDFA